MESREPHREPRPVASSPEAPGERLQLGPLLALLLVLAPAYALTLARTVQGADNGEFCTLFATGGVAHPSGYPLYTIWLRAFAWLPTETPALGAASATAILGIGGAMLLYAACRAWGAGAASAAVSTALYAASPLAWDLATQAEVFTLNATIAAAILWVTGPHGPAKGTSRAASLGLLAGLGLSNHLTIVLLLPVGLWGAWRGVKESARPIRAASIAALALLVGLLPYVTIPFAAHGDPTTRWVWGDVTSLRGVVQLASRADYGTTTLAVGAAPRRPFAQIAGLLVRLVIDTRGLPFFAAFAFLARPPRDAARHSSHPRWGLSWLAVSFVLAGPFFAALMNLPGGPSAASAARRFHLLPAALLVVPGALGLDWWARRWRPFAGTFAVLGTMLANVAFALPVLSDERRPMLENYVIDTLRTTPPRAVVLGSGDQRFFGFLYARLGLRFRRDVIFLTPILLHHPWYRARVGAELGFEPVPPKNGSINTVELAGQILSHGRRLFLTDEVSFAIVRSFPTYPLGTLLEVLAPGAPLPSPGDLERVNLQLFAGYHIDPEVLKPDRAWSESLRDGYQRPWRALAEVFRQQGDTAGAARNAERATLAPWLAP